MQPQRCDWRLQGQEKYLFKAIFSLKRYSERIAANDHDHCEFCNNKFSDIIPDSLTEGYSTQDDYRWVCKACFADFKDKFEFTLKTK